MFLKIWEELPHSFTKLTLKRVKKGGELKMNGFNFPG
jgi:hypothetical protein